MQKNILFQISFLLLIIFSTQDCLAQSGDDFDLYYQKNGRNTFTMIGNSFNKNGNSAKPNYTSCSDWLDYGPNHISKDELDVGANTIVQAFVLWSSNVNDRSITVNDDRVTSDKSFVYYHTGTDMFTQVSDITDIVINHGNGDYIVSDLDLDRSVNCGASYGGWSIIVVYEDLTLPRNSVSLYIGSNAIYDGKDLKVKIPELKVGSSVGSILGMIAWEGEKFLAEGETITFNNYKLFNAANPVNNAFNGTNSFTNKITPNVDIDKYDISAYVDINTDDDVFIEAKSDLDLVLFSCFAFSVNAEFPEPTIEISSIEHTGCNENTFITDFIVKNENANEVLPAGTEIKFYQDQLFSEPIYEAVTNEIIPIDGSITFTDVEIPFTLGTASTETIFATINLDRNGEKILIDLNPDNNTDEITLNVLSNYETTPDLVEICEGESFTLADGVTIVTDTGTYSTPIIDDNGCTNTVIQEIIVNPLPNSAPAELIECSLTRQATFNLQEATPTVQNGDDSLTVIYFASEAEAEDLTNLNGLPDNYTSDAKVIYARVRNSFSCFKIEKVTLTTAIQPQVGTVNTLEECDDDRDEIASFDLTQKLNEIYNGQDQSLFTIDFYEDSGLANNIANPNSYTNSSNPQTIFYSITNNKHQDCTESGSFEIFVNELPFVNNVPISKVNCSSTLESSFDLTSVIDEVRDNNSAMNVEFYRDENLTTQITDLANYTTPSATVYGKVINPLTNCYNVGKVELKVTAIPLSQDLSATERCEETPNGTASFDLTEFTGLLVQDQVNVEISYHLTYDDANSNSSGGSNPITNTQNFETRNREIYARSEATFGNTFCHSVSKITLPVNELPTINVIDTYTECSDTDEALFDLESKIVELIDDPSAMTVKFYDSLANAQDGSANGILPNNYTSLGETIFVRVENNITSCYSVSSFDLNVSVKPVINRELIAREYLANGVAIFNLDELKDEILVDYPSLTLEFYETDSNLDDPTVTDLTGNYSITENENLTLKYYSDNEDCYNTINYQFLINEVPFTNLGDQIVCLDEGYLLPNGEIATETGEYVITYLDTDLGYDVSVQINLIVGEIFFPTAFAPNNNGYNESFKAVPGEACLGRIEDYSLEVFDRWGELIFKSNEFSQGWDGLIEGAPAHPGVYAYRSTFKFDGKTEIRNGAVSLLR